MPENSRGLSLVSRRKEILVVSCRVPRLISFAQDNPSSLEGLVRSSGFEPPRYCYRQPLKLVRLPVPPRPRRVNPRYRGFSLSNGSNPTSMQEIMIPKRITSSYCFGGVFCGGVLCAGGWLCGGAAGVWPG